MARLVFAQLCWHPREHFGVHVKMVASGCRNLFQRGDSCMEGRNRKRLCTLASIVFSILRLATFTIMTNDFDQRPSGIAALKSIIQKPLTQSHCNGRNRFQNDPE